METVRKNDLWVMQIFLLRISYHSKKMGGAVRQKVIAAKELLSKAKDTADKLCYDETVDSSLKKLL